MAPVPLITLVIRTADCFSTNAENKPDDHYTRMGKNTGKIRWWEKENVKFSVENLNPGLRWEITNLSGKERGEGG